LVISIFDLPHIFIVFNGGSGGNFIAGVINELSNSTLNSLDISTTGSSHNVLRDKSKGTDFLSFGTMLEEHSLFKSEEEREKYYLENIKNRYLSTLRPEVVWTHDFTNIPYYRKHFKNARILVVTTTTPNEQLTSLFMLVTKVILDKDCILPMTPDLWNIFTNRWIAKCNDMLSSFMSRDDANMIMADRYNSAYKDTLLYATMTMFLAVRQMSHLVDDVPEQEVLLNYVAYPFKLKIENNLNSYIDHDCVVLPYRYLADNDFDLLIEKLSAALTKDLKQDEINYVRSSFEKYRSAQNETILSNPAEYYKELRRKILNT